MICIWSYHSASLHTVSMYKAHATFMLREPASFPIVCSDYSRGRLGRSPQPTQRFVRRARGRASTLARGCATCGADAGTGHHFPLLARAVPIHQLLKIRKKGLDTSGKSVLLISTSFEEGYRDESTVGKERLSTRPCRYSGSKSARGSRFWQVARLRIDDDRFACCPCFWCDHDTGSKQDSNACNRLRQG